MPFLNLANSTVAVDLSNPDLVTFASFISSTPTKWSWLTTAGHRVDVFGTGFTYSNGRATAGTATDIVFDLSNDGQGALELLAFGLSFPASTLDDSADSFWRILDGNDTITGLRFANLTVNAASSVFGDGINARNGTTGGNDTIDAGDTETLAVGDVFNVGSESPGGPAITYTGGNDTISNQYTIEGALLYGDVEYVWNGCRLIGGDDKIILRSANGPTEAYGDARIAQDVGQALTEVVGGDDLLDASQILFRPVDTGAILVGDVDGAYNAIVTGGADKLLGSSWNDVLTGDVSITSSLVTGGADEIRGNGGDDEIYGDVQQFFVSVMSGGDDILYGGPGNDVMFGEIGSEQFFVTTSGGNDRMYGEAGADIMYGQSGNDILDGGADVDKMIGGVGDDHFYVDNAVDTVFEAAGGGTADRVLTSVSYTLAANQQIELLSTTFSVGTAAIGLTGNNLANTILGNNGVNVINGGGGIDRMTGLNGNDLYLVDSLFDTVFESTGGGTADRVLTSVNYVLADNQQIELFSTTNSAGIIAVNLVGNNLANRILGNNGVNVINGGLSNDFLTGGLGADQFRFATAIAGGGNVDTISDFTHLTDDIQLAQSIFTGIGGALNTSEFKLGTVATTAVERIIYDGVTGNLFFDADGNGATAQVQFAKVTASTALDINDFIMI